MMQWWADRCDALKAATASDKKAVLPAAKTRQRQAAG